MNYALVGIDCQYDYLPGGVLDAWDSLRVVQNLNPIARAADLVILTRDWHPENHFSFSDDPQWRDGSWPHHCVQGTKGAKIFPALRKYADYVISKGMNRNPPDDYSAWSGKTLRPVKHLAEIMAENPRIETVVVGGFVLEFAVQFTAFDFNAVGEWNVIVPLDCTTTLASSDRDTADIIEKKLRHTGVRVVNTWKDYLSTL